MAYGRCELKRRHDGPHIVTREKDRIRWDADGAAIDVHAQNSVDEIRLTFAVKPT